MNKKLFLILISLFPSITFAASNSSLSFAPPPSDLSVVFLGNIFGIVDGVLHGTGSQILGTMFGVFNSAVLVLGGIIIMYTLLVSTMNTAHEGQMLGQKWSSIWIPLRSTLGLALLIPKASGYCLMQIFVMWIVLQGVGAADKIWSAALGYLNRGGYIIQTQMDPKKALRGSNTTVANGAVTILAGQVCMLGLQTALQKQRQSYLNAKEMGAGPCAGSPSKVMKDFCEASVPDFLNTVNAVAQENTGSEVPSSYKVLMPNFESGSMFAPLNGICGNITWNSFSSASLLDVKKNISAITPQDLETAGMSRAIAVQQMYDDLTGIARLMIGNDPEFNPPPKEGESEPPFSKVAIQQYGVAYTNAGVPCDKLGEDCTRWGKDPSSPSAPLFNGNEFQGAIADYHGIMLPTLNLLSQAKNSGDASKRREFIQKAVDQGWILAGSYFFNLVRLSSPDIETANKTDNDSGLDGSEVNENNLVSSFNDTEGCVGGDFGMVCELFNGYRKPLENVVALIHGTNVNSIENNGVSAADSSITSSIITKPVLVANSDTQKPEIGKGSSTVYGFVKNAVMINVPGQPGLEPPLFAMKFKIKIDFQHMAMKTQDFPCGEIKLFGIRVACLGKLLGDIFYNLIIKNLFNFFLNLIAPVVNTVVMTFLAAPLTGIAQIFQNAVAIIQQPSVNPVVALANMGITYINYANELWVLLIGLSITTMIIPLFGIFIVPLIMLAMPLLITWLGIMVAIGFITAYYIPLLPYMIFTLGSIAWIISVIEAMVAAPIVALGVTHPEGHDAFGKGENAIMILMNIFLRPSLMIIGYIAGIALCYVAVWLINAGFANASAFIQGAGGNMQWNFSHNDKVISPEEIAKNMTSMQTGYVGWAGVYGFFFSVLMYTTMYLLVVQKSFTLITSLPDRVLRWIGGQPESIGQEAAQWGEEAKGKVEGAADKTSKAAGQTDQQLSGYGMKAAGWGKSQAGKSGSKVDTDAGDSMPE